MFKSLYTLSEKYSCKKIIIYGVNRTSVNLFADLVLNYDVNVHAFLDVEDRFTGESFVNRRIINVVQLQQFDNAVVVIPSAYDKKEICKCISLEIEVCYKNEVFDLNKELMGKRIYLYGIGKKGEAIYDALKTKGMEPEGVCVTERGRIGKWCGKEVFLVEQIKREKKCAVIISTDNKYFVEEMLEQLADCEAEKYIPFYVRDYMPINFFQVINIALLNNKKIWMYGDRDENTRYLKKILDKYQIDIDQEIYGKGIYRLSNEDVKEITIVVAERDAHKSEQIFDILDSLGYQLEKMNYTALTCCTMKPDGFRMAAKKDILLGSNTFADEKYPGYFVYGVAGKAKVKIMVLGSSTSTSNVFRTVSWVDFLYEEMLEKGYYPIIYNGSVSAYGIVEEFLHMVRDIEVLRPDYIISFSGINNTFNKRAVNQFNTQNGEWIIKSDSSAISGIKSTETLYDFWCRISKLMKVTAEYYGAKLYSFLQPMSVAKEELDLIETSLFDMTEHTKHIREYKRRAELETDKFYINMLSMFEDRKEMYIDMCHYSTEANRLIAESIFEVIKPDMERRREQHV